MRRASLNHAYRLIWSDITHTYVAVAETTKACGKRSTLAVAVALTLLPAIAGAADILGPGPFVGVTDENFTVQNGVTVSETAGSKAIVIYVGNIGSPYTSTLLNLGTVSNIGVFADSSAASQAYGIHIMGNLATPGALNNSGQITVDVTQNGCSGSCGANVVATGIGTGLVTGTLTNNGAITVAATRNDNYEANAYGISVAGVGAGGSVVNAQGRTITVTANGTGGAEAHAYGINVGADLAGSISNAGTIDVTAHSTSDSAAQAFGINIGGNLSGSLTNTSTGVIRAFAQIDQNSSTIRAFGIFIDSNLTGSLTNNGSITAEAKFLQDEYYAYAHGIYVGGTLSGTLTNTGNITALSENLSGSSGAAAYGIRLDALNSLGTLNNSGTISATAHSYSEASAHAYGVYLAGSMAGTLINSGTISASVINDSSDSQSAYGVSIDSALSGSLTNSGSISATSINNGSSNAAAYGINIGAGISGTLTNTSSGRITAEAQSNGGASAIATAIRIDSGGISSTGSLTNSGTISATATGTTSVALGVNVRGDVAGVFSNALGAQMLTSATAGTGNSTAYTVYITGALNEEFTNDGLIKATAVTNNSNYASAYGVYLGGTLASGVSLTNSGTISATATSVNSSGSAAGIFINNRVSGSILNTGTITATHNVNDPSLNGDAWGIYVRGDLDGTITNAGTISGLSNGDRDKGVSIRTNGGTGSVINNVNALLRGSIQLGGTVNLVNAGGIDLTQLGSTGLNGLGSGSVGGDFTQVSVPGFAASYLRIGAYGSGVGEYSQMIVTGNAHIEGTIAVDVRNGNTGPTKLAVDGILAGVVQSTGLTGNFTTVTDNSALFNFVSLVNGDNIDLSIVKGQTTTDIVNETGNRAARAAAAAIDKIIDSGTATGDMQTVINALGGLSSQEVSNAVSQTLPLITGATTQAVMQGVSNVTRIVQSRQEGQQGRSSGDEFYGDKKFWFKPFGTWGNQNDRKGVSGYDANSYGMVFGADAEISTLNRLGLAFAYFRSDVDGGGVARQNADINSYEVIMYGSHSLAPNTDISMQVDVGMHDTDGKRGINFGGLNRQAKSSYDSWSGHVGAALAHTLNINPTTNFTPSVRADYTFIRNESYDEKNAGTLNLNVSSQRAEAFIVGVDGKLSHALTDKTQIVANLGLGYDLINEQASLSSAFAGSPSTTFVTKGIDPSPWLARGGVGLVGKATETTELSARYDFEVRENYDNQTASVKVRWAF